MRIGIRCAADLQPDMRAVSILGSEVESLRVRFRSMFPGYAVSVVPTRTGFNVKVEHSFRLDRSHRVIDNIGKQS